MSKRRTSFYDNIFNKNFATANRRRSRFEQKWQGSIVFYSFVIL